MVTTSLKVDGEETESMHALAADIGEISETESRG